MDERYGYEKYESKSKIATSGAVRNHNERGRPGKTRPFWLQNVYKIPEKEDEESLVYALQEENNQRT